jgi:hypothetical protein
MAMTIPDHPIQKKIIVKCDDGHPPPELKFLVCPELRTWFKEDTGKPLPDMMQSMVLVYRYDERISRDTYQYLFVGGRIE